MHYPLHIHDKENLSNFITQMYAQNDLIQKSSKNIMKDKLFNAGEEGLISEQTEGDNNYQPESEIIRPKEAKTLPLRTLISKDGRTIDANIDETIASRGQTTDRATNVEYDAAEIHSQYEGESGNKVIKLPKTQLDASSTHSPDKIQASAADCTRSMVLEATHDSHTLEHDRNNYSKLQSTDTDRKKHSSIRSGDGYVKQIDMSRQPPSPTPKNMASLERKNKTIYNSI
jgi:hypothetical protein